MRLRPRPPGTCCRLAAGRWPALRGAGRGVTERRRLGFRPRGGTDRSGCQLSSARPLTLGLMSYLCRCPEEPEALQTFSSYSTSPSRGLGLFVSRALLWCLLSGPPGAVRLTRCCAFLRWLPQSAPHPVSGGTLSQEAPRCFLPPDPGGQRRLLPQSP